MASSRSSRLPAATGRAVGVVGLAVLVVLAGCGDVVSLGRQGPPEGDPLGWEDGHWYDDDLSVTPGDGLDEDERRAVVARAMARVERIRRLEFTERVPVSVISREEYRTRFDEDGDGNGDENGNGDSATFHAWNDQVWEALFLVGEDSNTSSELDTVYSETVQGFYSPDEDEIVIVSDSETPQIDRRTLAHELVHAVRDQRPPSQAGDERTQDQQLAADGLREGDANLVEAIYERRCTSKWDCLPRPDRTRGGGTDGGTDGETDGGSAGGPPAFDRGVFLTVYAPYAAGPKFVVALRERGGWAAVNDAYRSFPVSTEQVIHPEAYPDEKPVSVTVPDRSGPDWERFDLEQVADTVGEASIYAMFRINGQITGGSQFDYDHSLSAGWGGDSVVPYRDGNRYGYVWTTVWDTPGDAREFLEGYRGVLEAHDARSVGGDVYVVPDSDRFGDAFRLTRHGDTVVVVNAPTRRDLADVHSPR